MRLTAKSFVQPVWDTETTQLFRTRFKAVSPKRVDTPWTRYGEPFSAGRCGGRIDMACRRVPYL
ncbi:capsid protein of prophage [Escherichia coli]|nr:capsid protein of prophage [Escherichia coli]